MHKMSFSRRLGVSIVFVVIVCSTYVAKLNGGQELSADDVSYLTKIAEKAEADLPRLGYLWDEEREEDPVSLLNGSDLEWLKKYHDDTVAIFASWRLALKQVQPDLVPDPEIKGQKLRDTSRLHQFRGFVEGRLRVSVPKLWNRALTNDLVIYPGYVVSINVYRGMYDGIDPPVPLHEWFIREYGYSETRLGILTPRRTLKIDVDRDNAKLCKVTYRGDSIAVDREQFDHAFLATALAYEDDIILALFNKIPLKPFSTILCIRKSDSAIRWVAHGFGAHRRGGGYSGTLDHHGDLRRSSDRVVLFGFSTEALSIEAFSLRDGKMMSRFGTYMAESID